MKAPREVLLASLAVAAIAAVSFLVMSPLDRLLSGWLVRVHMPATRLTQWILTPFLAGLVGGSFGTALFRTRRWVLPLAPAVALFAGLSFEWLRGWFGFHPAGLLASMQWRALALSLPFGAVIGVVVVRGLYPGGRG